MTQALEPAVGATVASALSRALSHIRPRVVGVEVNVKFDRFLRARGVGEAARFEVRLRTLLDDLARGPAGSRFRCTKAASTNSTATSSCVRCLVSTPVGKPTGSQMWIEIDFEAARARAETQPGLRRRAGLESDFPPENRRHINGIPEFPPISGGNCPRLQGGFDFPPRLSGNSWFSSGPAQAEKLMQHGPPTEPTNEGGS